MLTTCDIVGVIHNVNSFHPILSGLAASLGKGDIGGAHLIRNQLKENQPGSLLTPPTYAYEVDNGLSLYFRADKWSMRNDDSNIPHTPHMVTFGNDPWLNVNLTRIDAKKSGNFGSVSVSVAHVIMGSDEGGMVNLHKHIQVNDSIPFLLLGIKQDSAHILDDESRSTKIKVPMYMAPEPSLTLSSSNTIYRIHVPNMYLPTTSVSAEQCCVFVRC
jgi:hypothetical protein